jgi:hypothetical protein
LTMQRLHMLQWCAREGLKAWQRLQNLRYFIVLHGMAGTHQVWYTSDMYRE